MFGDPEFFNVEMLKQMGLWPLNFLPAYGIAPYLKRMRNDITGVELGVLKGETSFVILDSCPNVKKMYGIDPYAAHFDGAADRTEEEMSQYETIMKINMNRFGDRWEHIKKSSHDCADMFENESLDFIFIDSIQLIEHLSKELELWYPKIKKNGIIFGHDAMTESVIIALKNFRNKHKIRIPINHSKNQVWFWTKP
jgi:predicted O-methyltransferase YrrM